MQAITADFNGKTIDLAVGQVIELRLTENPTTGFRWQVRGDGAPACRIAGDFFDKPTGGQAMPGAGGVHVWRIEGVQAGSCEMDLAYNRGWETKPPADTFALHINVKA